MANLKELRLRIGSVKNTRKITAAMSQIASARLRKAQNAAMAARPYGERMEEVVSGLVAGIPEAERGDAHPLLGSRGATKHTLVIAMTADKGLCGGFNGNINRAVTRFVKEEQAEGRKTSLLLVGRKADAFFKFDETVVDRLPAPSSDTIVELSKDVAHRAIAAYEGKGPEDRPGRPLL